MLVRPDHSVGAMRHAMPLVTTRWAANRLMRAVFTVCVSAFILGTRLNLFGINANLSIVGMAGISALQLMVFERTQLANYLKAMPYVVLCVALALCSAGMQYWLHGTEYQFYFSRICVNYALYIVTAIAACNVMNALRLDLIALLLTVFYVAALNGVIIALEFNFPIIRTTLEGWLVQAEGSNINYKEVSWRLRGIAAEGGASLSIFMALGIAAGALAVHKGRLSALPFMVGSVTILIALITVARTGLYLGLALFAAFIVVQLATGFRRNWPAVAVALLLPVFYFSAASQNYSAVAPWAFELFNNLYQRGELRTDSTDDLRAMFGEPPSNLQMTEEGRGSARSRMSGWGWVFGIGFFDGNAPFRNDSGYIKTIYSVGGIGALFIYGLFAFHLLAGVSRRLGWASYIWIFYLGALFVSELKEPLLYQNYTGRSLALIIAGAYLVCAQWRQESAPRTPSDHSSPVPN